MDVKEQDLLKKYPKVFLALLKDHTRTAYEKARAKVEGREIPDDQQWNIIWGTENYQKLGPDFAKDKCIIGKDITDDAFNEIIMPRVRKDKDTQRKRSRDMAEVFTPAWVCNAQNNLIDEAWFGRNDVFNRVDENDSHQWIATTGNIVFPEEPSLTSTRSWKDYVRDLRMEITCGEGPYLVSRYDVVTGDKVPVFGRIGLLDRKLRIVSENTKTSGEWLEWAREAVMATYGFEWQGDNLLLAREAVLFTVKDFYEAKASEANWRQKKLSAKSFLSFAYIISWNLWQMDGLKMVLPYSCHDDIRVSMDLWGNQTKTVVHCSSCAKGERTGHNGIKCLVRDWQKWKNRKRKASNDWDKPFEESITKK